VIARDTEEGSTSECLLCINCLHCRSVLHQLNLEWLPVHRNWRLNERHYGALQVGSARMQLQDWTFRIQPALLYFLFLPWSCQGLTNVDRREARRRAVRMAE